MDNFKTHSLGAFYHVLCTQYKYETFDPEEAKRLIDRFEFVYTPKHGSWLNVAEIELCVLNSQYFNRQVFNIEYIKKEIKAWQVCRNNKNCKINWQFSTTDARIKLRRLYTHYFLQTKYFSKIIQTSM